MVLPSTGCTTASISMSIVHRVKLLSGNRVIKTVWTNLNLLVRAVAALANQTYIMQPSRVPRFLPCVGIALSDKLEIEHDRAFA